MSQPASQRGQESQRSQEQIARERASAEVSDVLLNLEHALARAKKAQKAVSKDGADPNAELALGNVVKEIDRLRKRLTQDTYFAGDALRLI
jgi:hypothetical protein